MAEQEKNATSVPVGIPVRQSSIDGEETRAKEIDKREVTVAIAGTVDDDGLKEAGVSQSETLPSVPLSEIEPRIGIDQLDQSLVLSEVPVKDALQLVVVEEVKGQEETVHEEPANNSGVATVQQQMQIPDGPSRLDSSPTSVTQSLSSTSSPSQPQHKVLQITNGNKRCLTEMENPKSPLLKLSHVLTPKTPSDGFNWRKYGQKQVKSPEGSRSYYRCTSSDCCAKKIECSDLSNRVIETVYRSHHNHEPPSKLNCSRESRSAIPSPTATRVSAEVTHPVRALNDKVPSTSKESLPGTVQIPETKQQESNDSDETLEINAKDEHVDGPEHKKRKNETTPDLGTPPKPFNKPKFVVHAAGDVAISGDGYRWRKYGQKMVKGNPHPRNYYRCTSAGCPVRKHIEKAVDSTTALIITYKGGHNHDMPVPKKIHRPKNAPRISGTSVPEVTLQIEGSESHHSQKQQSMDKEGISTDVAMDLITKKSSESPPALLSVGFEIKPC